MKRELAAILSLVCVSACLAAKPEQEKPAAGKAAGAAASPVVWKLKFTEDFNGTKLNEKLWSRIGPGTSDWNRNMSLRPDLIAVKGGQLHAYGVKNADRNADPRSVLTGGVSTKGHYAVKYGKVEIKCKLEGQKGAWPAIWMMPEPPAPRWPHGGEIDIIEKLNFDDFVYHTVHSGWTKDHKNDPPNGGKGSIKANDWNVYAIEWTPEQIVWKVNGKTTHSYAKVGDDHARFPWTTPFYLMIDMQLGGEWVGAIDESTLPTAMHVDWVKFYSGSRDGKTFTEFVDKMK